MRGGEVATHGWLQSTDVQARERLTRCASAACSNFVFTNVDHDGMLDGANRDEVAWVGEGRRRTAA